MKDQCLDIVCFSCYMCFNVYRIQIYLAKKQTYNLFFIFIFIALLTIMIYFSRYIVKRSYTDI